jgi:dTDP-4-dehydrorhamnose reductase
MAKPCVLVTGGSGYLGRRVVEVARIGWDVIATYFTHRGDDLEDGGERGVIWRRLDVRDGAAVEALVGEVRPAVIVHTAAANPGVADDFEQVNADGTGHVARAAAVHGARLVHMSTDVLFDGEKGNYVEADPPTPITPYGRSKALAEAEVRASGARAVIVRTSLIYDWRQRADKLHPADRLHPADKLHPSDRHTRWIVEGLRAGQPVRLFTDELRCPIWVESLAAAVVELAGMDYTGVLHVAGAQVLSRYEFGVRLLRFHGFDPSPIIPVRSQESGMRRPLDCTLDCSRARALLRTPLPGVDEVLGQQMGRGKANETDQ